MTSLSLSRLKQEAGVFIAESEFQVIELEYMDYLAENNYTDSETVANQFIEKWKDVQEELETFHETTDGAIKFYSMEGTDNEMTTAEFLDNLDMTSYHWENMCRRDWKVFREILETETINKELISNILKEQTLSYEQIYELIGGAVLFSMKLNNQQ